MPTGFFHKLLEHYGQRFGGALMRLLPASASILAALLAAEVPPRMPMPNDYTNSIKTRWLAKPVLDSRMLDDA